MNTDATRRPNVLLITVDQMPASAMGCSGHPAVQTPTLDQLADNGIRFTNCYSECPVCVPARRTLMTSLNPRAHGMQMNAHAPMPPVPTLAQHFRDHGYQAYAVGKLHVQPQRQRIGFDDVLLDEEGRILEGVVQDDYELFLADHGHAGERFAGGMNNNEYVWRPWHLDEHLHVTNWAAQSMCRLIKRRDPLRPAFWYLSFSQPHPPLTPLSAYLDIYDQFEIPDPYRGEWAGDDADTPTWIRIYQNMKRPWNPAQIRAIRRAYYAAITHIDHQLRLVIGTLREEGLLKDTVILFTADHGDMLGNHGMWAKSQMHEDSNNVPLIVQGLPDGPPEGDHRVDDRLCGLADVMPTLLTRCDLPVPGHCQGLDLLGSERREVCFSECYDERERYGESTTHITRMVRDARYKLIYYAMGNRRQLFDLEDDPCELYDLAGDPARAADLERLTAALIDEFANDSGAYIADGRLVGQPDPGFQGPGIARTFQGQRGSHLPPPLPGEVPW